MISQARALKQAVGRAAWWAMCGAAFCAAPAADQPQWGQAWSRNMVSYERGLPESFDPQTGRNLKWTAALGTETYSTPVVGRGVVLIGTNNNRPRDSKHQGDRGVLLCLDEATGQLRWQLVTPKYNDDIYQDWPHAGICASATIEGNRAYILDNRRSVLCLDLEGLANGNDGPYTDEGQYLTPTNAPRMTPGPLDADILWRFDVPEQAGIWPHDGAHAAILIRGDHLYLNSGNGVDNTHRRIRRPEGPSLIVLDKHTGRYLARDRENMGPRIFHCTWSPPALARVQGVEQIIFCGGDGVIYGFTPWAGAAGGSEPGTLQKRWQIDFDPTGPKEDVHRFISNRKESPSNIKSTPVVVGDRVYVTGGGDIWWGKNEAWLKCYAITGEGDITAHALVWSVPLQRHTCSTPAVHEGLVYAADCSGQVLCADAATGQVYWRHQLAGEIWSSPLVADGRVYIGSRRGDLAVLATGRELRVLATLQLDSAIVATPVAANGVLYVATMRTLYAAAARPSPP
ncbi:PQQ-binding-like beta-propeller repeat protein [Fontisphaera persica]|uniref:outer membrane protein assembly factor BamB family protein n=1 Tax=Fontisphaera persica TaxID=2974023 RepID=UPI0024BF3158|nr:PQQ-binding-like beta-propeller repeat protein [Fontisphaera persica]WCJ58396.1 PQQ-binding-like beta-propeller repeat protein [Fontisphaera persica]